jgi:uncharacterized protein
LRRSHAGVIRRTVKRAPRCPICRKDVAPRSKNPSFPFCSQRCRQVDLGKWIGEEYRVVGGDAADEREDELPPMDESDSDSPKMH